MAGLNWTLRSGRRVGVSGFGDPLADRLIVFCHPVPGAASFDPDPAVSSAARMRGVALDRPGYGASDPIADDSWPSVAAAADDIAEYLIGAEGVAEAMGAEGFDTRAGVGVVGWSAGGRVALALAARHPQLVDRVAVVATPAPDSQVRWIAEDLALATRRLLSLPPAEAKAQLMAMLDSSAPEGGVAADRIDPSVLGASSADEAALSAPGARSRVTGMLREAFRQGQAGVADDILSYGGDDWGFRLADVRADTLLVYGGSDPLVGEAHAQWYRSQLPAASVRITPDAGHFVIVPEWERILRHLVPDRAG